MLVTMPRVSRSCKHFPDEFNLHPLQEVARRVEVRGHRRPRPQPNYLETLGEIR